MTTQSPDLNATKLESYDAIAQNLLGSTLFSLDLSRAAKQPFWEQELLRANITTLPYRSGVWVTQQTSRSASSQRDIVFHWPLILDRLLSKNKSSLRLLPPSEAHMVKQALLRYNDNAGRKHLMEALEHHVLRGLPAGISVPCPTYLHNFLRKRYAESSDVFIRKNFDRVSVLRFGPILSHESEHLFPTLKKYNALHITTLSAVDPRVLFNMPLALRLLYVALTQVRFEPPGSGWARWGLLWGAEQLHFNHRVAAQTALSEEHTALFFEELSVDEICASVLRVPLGRRILKHHSLPVLSDITITQQSKGQHLLRRAQTMAWILEHPGITAVGPREWREVPENYTTFSLTSATTVLDYFKQLSELTEIEVSYLIADLGARPQPKQTRPTVRTTGRFFPYHYEEVIPVTVNAFSLDYVIPSVMRKHAVIGFAPMTIKTVVYRDEAHISLPLEFMAHFPRAKTLEHKLGYFKDGDIYFPLNLLKADGEILPLLDKTVEESDKDFTSEHINYVKAFKMLCQWLLDPSKCSPRPTGEFQAAYPFNVTKEVFVNTERERFEFLRQKGKCLRKKNVTTVQRKGYATERSGRVSVYDRFLFTYIAHEVIMDEYIRPSDIVYADFISKYWMPWRRLSGNLPHLKRVQESQLASSLNPKRLEGATVTVATCLEFTKDFPQPFTQETPRTSAPYTDYTYQVDIIK